MLTEDDSFEKRFKKNIAITRRILNMDSEDTKTSEETSDNKKKK